MAGTPDITVNFRRKTELDFRHRLIAKFAIPRAKRFWNSGFEAMPRTALYPSDDRVETLCAEITARMWNYLPEPTHPFELISEWAEIEEALLNEARRITEKNLPVGRAIDELVARGRINKDLAAALHRIRNVRNTAAHRPRDLGPGDIAEALTLLREIRPRLPDLSKQSRFFHWQFEKHT